jgi:hypothetical protein
VKKVLGPAFIADKSEAFIDEQTRNCPGRHFQALPVEKFRASLGRFDARSQARPKL